MQDQLSATTRHRLNVQGFEGIPDQMLAEVAPWLRMAFALCATLAALGTIAASSANAGGDCGFGCHLSCVPIRPDLQLWHPSCDRNATAAQTWCPIALRLRRWCTLADGRNLGVSSRVSLGRVHTLRVA